MLCISQSIPNDFFDRYNRLYHTISVTLNIGVNGHRYTMLSLKGRRAGNTKTEIESVEYRMAKFKQRCTNVKCYKL